jgi:hypothetical protein
MYYVSLYTVISRLGARIMTEAIEEYTQICSHLGISCNPGANQMHTVMCSIILGCKHAPQRLKLGKYHAESCYRQHHPFRPLQTP